MKRNNNGGNGANQDDDGGGSNFEDFMAWKSLRGSRRRYSNMEGVMVMKGCLIHGKYTSPCSIIDRASQGSLWGS